MEPNAFKNLDGSSKKRKFLMDMKCCTEKMNEFYTRQQELIDGPKFDNLHWYDECLGNFPFLLEQSSFNDHFDHFIGAKFEKFHDNF